MNSLNFIGDCKLLSKKLKSTYKSIYIYKNIVSVNYNKSVRIKVKEDSFFVGIINIFNRSEIAKDLNIEKGDDFDLVYSLTKTKGIRQAVNKVDGEFAFVGQKVKNKFLHTLALKDPVFVKLGFNKFIISLNYKGVPKNSIVFGSSPSLIFKECKSSVIEQDFIL